MAKVEILAIAAGLPRTDLVAAVAGPADEAQAVLGQLFPGRIGAPLADADLLSASYPEYGRIYAGTFGDAVIVCGQDLIELADLAAVAISTADGRNVFRLQINSEIDSVGLEIVAGDGEPVRELMLVADAGVVVDDGAHLEFEAPFWSGRNDLDGAFTTLNGPEMPFDVVDFGEEALRTLFGFVVDAHGRSGDIDPRRIVLHGFVIAADHADPADMAQARSGHPVPPLPDDPVAADPAPAPGGRRLRDPGPSDDDGSSGSGGSGGARTAPVDPPASSRSATGGSWWKRLLERLFD